MTWDYAVGQEWIRIEEVDGDEVLGLIAEIPRCFGSAEIVAEAICNAHNKEIANAKS